MDFDKYIADMIEQVKDFLFSDVINSFILDYSKNELLTLFFLHRKRQANMGQIAEYLHAPLNTATGVVTRLVNKKLIDRFRSEADRRVVLLKLTTGAIHIVEDNIRLIMEYLSRVNDLLTEEEKSTLFSVIGKVRGVLLNPSQAVDAATTTTRIRKITIE